MDYYLLRKGNHADPLRINLNKNEVTVGRKFFPELQISNHVSRQHVSFKISSDGEWFVTDLNSLNGVYINGLRVEQPLHRVKLGDSIGLGVIHAVTNDNFEFELCRMNIKIETEDDNEIIILSDNGKSVVKESCSINLGNMSDQVVNPKENNIRLQDDNESFLSYKHVYSDIINSKQPVVVLTRCDAKPFRQSNNSFLKKNVITKRAVHKGVINKNAKKPHRKNKRILFDSSSEYQNSDFEDSCLPKKRKHMKSKNKNIPKKTSFSNVFSSDTSSDSELDVFLQQNRKDKIRKRKYSSNKVLIDSTPAGELLSERDCYVKENHKCLPCLSTSKDTNISWAENAKRYRDSPFEKKESSIVCDKNKDDDFSFMPEIKSNATEIMNPLPPAVKIENMTAKTPETFVTLSSAVEATKCPVSKNCRDIPVEDKRPSITCEKNEDDDSSFKLKINCQSTITGEMINGTSTKINEMPYSNHMPSYQSVEIPFPVKIEKTTVKQSETSVTPPSLTTVLKTEVPTVAIKIEINKNTTCSAFEDDILGYSQVDEVIVISDGEDYLNFPPSQEKSGANLLNIKVEPVDCDDADFECQVEENQDNEDIKLNLQNISDEDQCSENVAAIQKFITKNSEPVQKSNSKNEMLHGNCFKVEKTKNRSEDIDTADYFPNLSQGFYSQNHSPSHHEFDDNVHDVDSYKRKSGVTKQWKSKCSTTVLTDPKPMNYRPRYQRGREEWFEDPLDAKNNTICKGKPKKSNDTTNIKRNVKKSQTESHSKKIATKKKKPFKERVQGQMGYRVRAPNGGSAIRLDSNQRCRVSPDKRKKPSHQVIGNQKPSVSTNVNLISKLERKKKVTSENRPKKDRFQSRMEALINIPNNAVRKNKKTDNLERVFKIPKIKPQITKKNNFECPIKVVPIPRAPQISNLLNHVKSSTATRCNIDNKMNSSLKSKDSRSYTCIPNSANSAINIFQTTPVPQIHAKNSNLDSEKNRSNLVQVSIVKNTVPVMTRNQNVKLPSVVLPFNTQEHIVQSSFEKNSLMPLRDPRIREPHTKSVFQNVRSDPSHIVNVQEQVCVVKPNNIHRTLLPTPKQSFEKSIRLDFDSVLVNVLNWNPTWLKEYKRIGKPPPCISKNVKVLPSSFDSLDHYIKSFYPITMLELWEYTFHEWEEIERTVRDQREVNAIGLMVTECVAKGDIMVLNCESVVTFNSAVYPREGNLIIVDLLGETQREVVKVFGYVSNHKSEKISSCRLHREWHKRPEAKLTNSVLYKFSLKTKKIKLKLALEKLMKGCVICYIANKIRLADGLQYLLTSQLRQDILQPSKKTLETECQNKRLPTAIHGRYNKNQHAAVISITEEMKAGYMVPKIILLQGPPGTGKTHTIAGIIQNLILDKNVKILVTAPSNAAVDEIGRRLIQLRKLQPDDRCIRIVRVGLLKQIHRELKPYTLENLTIQYAGRTDKLELDSLKKQLDQKDQQIKQISTEILSLSRVNSSTNDIGLMNHKLLMENRRKQHLLDEIDHVKKKTINFYDPSVYADKITVLEKANIILSTLGSCRLKILEKVFGQKSRTHFTCCIVDEAAQCTEPEILQPLVFGLSKFVLVGDYQQLPATVHSKLAIECNYHVSLFERIHNHFQKLNLPSPIRMLTEQYRMHSKICSFPSTHFYFNRLHTSANIDEKYKSFPLKPFIVLNIEEGKECNVQSSKKNLPEAEVIFQICNQLLCVLNLSKYSVGVITPYQAQKELVLRKFKENIRYSKIEVNTVDSFQGREKDIVILSCVRACGPDGNIGFVECEKRLNVAITRARQLLIICGHMKSLHNYANWRALIAYSKTKQAYVTVTSVKDIPFVIEEMKKVQCK